jgi:hypothetical protein
MTDGKYPKDPKQQDAIGGFLSPARHRPDGDTATADEAHGERKRSDLPGPPGEVHSRAQVAHEDAKPGSEAASSDGEESMTAAEQSGQMAYGAEQPTGEEGAIGAESSSG